MTDISIIIVCYKGWERLIKCLDSLSSFSWERFSGEVILVDNDSDDDSLNIIKSRYPEFRFIRNKINGGFGNGCNLGTRNSSGRFLLFLNPDTVAEEKSVEDLLKVADRNPDYTIVTCRQINEKGKETKVTGEFPSMFNLTGFERALFRNGKNRKADTGSDIIFPDWVSGSVIMVRKETFTEVGGFDEDFWMYFEDVDLCKRVRDNGGVVAYCRNISIEHNHGGSSRINAKITSLTKTEVYISRHVYISKHKSGMENLAIQTFLIVNNIISVSLSALPGIVLFFIPKLFSKTLIFFRLLSYYARALYSLSWISNRSVNA